MRIGIDISQMAFEGTGVARYVREMVKVLLAIDRENEYVLFGASLRRQSVFREYFKKINQELWSHPERSEGSSAPAHPRRFARFFIRQSRTQNDLRVRLIIVPIPPTILDWLWNSLHIVPVEWFVGPVDIFWSSDWTQPPLSKAKGITTIHDVSFLKFPESFAEKIIAVQKRRLKWAKKACQTILCDSEATKRDVHQLLNIDLLRLKVVYPGIKYDYRN